MSRVAPPRPAYRAEIDRRIASLDVSRAGAAP